MSTVSENYSIPHDDVVFLADQTRRLTGATGSMGFQDIKDGLESVVIGGGGGFNGLYGVYAESGTGTLET